MSYLDPVYIKYVEIDDETEELQEVKFYNFIDLLCYLHKFSKDKTIVIKESPEQLDLEFRYDLNMFKDAYIHCKNIYNLFLSFKIFDQEYTFGLRFAYNPDGDAVGLIVDNYILTNEDDLGTLLKKIVVNSLNESRFVVPVDNIPF